MPPPVYLHTACLSMYTQRALVIRIVSTIRSRTDQVTDSSFTTSDPPVRSAAVIAQAAPTRVR